MWWDFINVLRAWKKSVNGIGSLYDLIVMGFGEKNALKCIRFLYMKDASVFNKNVLHLLYDNCIGKHMVLYTGFICIKVHENQ